MHHRTDRVLAEFEAMLGALAPAAAKALGKAIVALDQGARLYPRARGRRLTQLDDETAEAYVRAWLARPGSGGELVRRIRSLVVMCYYELPPVQREIGYQPALISKRCPGAAWRPTGRRSGPARPRSPRAAPTPDRAFRERADHPGRGAW